MDIPVAIVKLFDVELVEHTDKRVAHTDALVKWAEHVAQLSEKKRKLEYASYLERKHSRNKEDEQMTQGFNEHAIEQHIQKQGFTALSEIAEAYKAFEAKQAEDAIEAQQHEVQSSTACPSVLGESHPSSK